MLDNTLLFFFLLLNRYMHKNVRHEKAISEILKKMKGDEGVRE